MAGRMINGAAALAELVRPLGDTDEPGVQRVLPVVSELSGLLPSRGLRRGSTVAVATGELQTGAARASRPSNRSQNEPAQSGRAQPGFAQSERAQGLAQSGLAESGPAQSERAQGLAQSGVPRAVLAQTVMPRAVPSRSTAFSPFGRLRPGQPSGTGMAGSAAAGGGTSLLLALLSAASRAGSWCAVVGVPTLGALAAAESGVALERLALVPHPGPEWPTVVAALIDGVDVVVVAVPGPIAPTIASRLVARARQRGCVLMPFGPWAGADVSLQVTRGVWEGLGDGHGRLRRREVTVTARGRGAAARPKEITVWMPGITAPPPIPPAPAQPIPATPAQLIPATPSSGAWATPLAGLTTPITATATASSAPGRAALTTVVPVGPARVGGPGVASANPGLADGKRAGWWA